MSEGLLKLFIFKLFFISEKSNFKNSEKLSLYHPSFLLKTTENKSQLDANLNMKIKNKIWVGASYRQDFGPSLFVGIDFGKLFSIYSHDISTNEAYSYSNGSHEFTIGYDFDHSLDSVVEKKVVVFDEFENDLDKDGVKDSLDLCPDQFGSANAHGCLDVDNDGIPNEYDLCPNLYGNLELQGCPEITLFEKNIVYKALNDLKFDFDKADIKYSSFPALTDMSILLLKNSKMYLHISGFSSSEGSSEYNMGLSARRAKAVQTFLVERGVKKSRLILDYFGESNPLNDNENELEKSLNRRVEFSLEYHIYAIEESKSLKNIYKQALIDKNIDYSFLNNSMSKNTINNSDFKNDYNNAVEFINNFRSNDFFNDEEQEVDTILDVEIKEEKIEIVEEEIKTENLDSLEDKSKFILVISVLSNESNAKSFIKKNSSVNYELIGGKYYFYEKSDSSKANLLKIKSTYNKDSWIKEIK